MDNLEEVRPPERRARVDIIITYDKINFRNRIAGRCGKVEMYFFVDDRVDLGRYCPIWLIDKVEWLKQEVRDANAESKS